MRSLVMSALSRPRATSSRSVFMLTGITSCTIGRTSAPPPSTTLVPPSPVRTKLRSFELRRYSQFSSQKTMATTIATAIRPRMKRPNSVPFMAVSGGSYWRPRVRAKRRMHPDVSLARSRFTAQCDEFPHVLGQCDFGRQALHARGAVEAMALGTLLHDLFRIGGDGQ